MTTNTPTSESTSSHDAKPKKRGLVWVVIFLLVAGVAGYAVYRAGQPNQFAGATGASGGRGGRGGRGGGRGAALGPTPVVINRVHRTNVPVYFTGLGSVIPYNTVTVKTRVDGQLMSVNFKEGDLVTQGQVLFTIDPRPFQVQLATAQGQYARDKAQLTNAELDLKRYQTLLAQNAIPQQQLDTQVAMVAQLEGTLKTDQAAIDNANLQLTYSQVTAPFAGRIGLRLVDPGNIVHASDQNGLLVIAQIHPIAVLFTVPEDNLPPVLKKLRDGVKLTVEAWNRDNSVKLGAGYLLTVDNQIDSTTGTSKLKAVFDNESGVLFPNQFVNIRLLVDTQRDQLVVPSVAIQHGQQGAFVYVVGDNSRVQLRVVTTGISLENTTQILSGLVEGDQVVVDGTDRLQNNSEVRIRPAGAGGGSGGRGGRGGSGRGGRGRSGQDADAAMAAPAAGDDGITAGADGTRRGGRGGRGGSGRGRGRRGGGTPE